jgi:hypothetical protein
VLTHRATWAPGRRISGLSTDGLQSDIEDVPVMAEARPNAHQVAEYAYTRCICCQLSSDCTHDGRKITGRRDDMPLLAGHSKRLRGAAFVPFI